MSAATPRSSRRLAAAVLATGVALGVVGFAVGAATLDGFVDRWAAVAGTFAVFALIGWVVASRVPGNAVGWLLLAMGAVPLVLLAVQVYAELALVTRPGVLPGGAVADWLGEFAWGAVWSTFALTLLLFPTGRPASPRWRVVVWAVAGNAAASVVVGGVALWPLRGAVVLGAEPAGLLGALMGVTSLGVAVAIVAGVVSLLLRYGRSDATERAQLRWIALAAVGVVPALAVVVARNVGVDVLPALDVVTFVPIVGIPVAIGLAVLRYRLYDVDRVLSRTVSYLLLSGVLAVVYLAGVVGLQQLLRPVTGSSELAVAGATLAAAAAFMPARRRIQAGVDRRFNRSRYDAEQAVAAFRQRLRAEVDLVDVATLLRQAAVASVQPRAVGVTLRTASSPERAP